MLKFLDVFFVVFHSLLILFNLFGWIFPQTRRLNLYTLLLTGGSWFLLGIFYGIGYCPLTDWHWQVLYKLGVYDLPGSYVQYLIERTLSISVTENFADILTVSAFFTLLIVSVWLNFGARIKNIFSASNSGN